MSAQSNIPRVPGLIDPLGGPGAAGAPTKAPATRPTDPGQFRRVLADEATKQAQAVTFSNHALQRLERRGLKPDLDQLARLTDSVDLAQTKGSRSALVLVDDVAFVVAVPARTVVTAIDRSQMKEQIFTNIDSAVIG
jgi:flagellar operon protein